MLETLEDLATDLLQDVRPQCTFQKDAGTPRCEAVAVWIMFESCGCTPTYCDEHLEHMRQFFDDGAIYGETVVECIAHRCLTAIVRWERI